MSMLFGIQILQYAAQVCSEAFVLQLFVLCKQSMYQNFNLHNPQQTSQIANWQPSLSYT